MAKMDYNVIAIGGGSAGLVSAYIAAAVKAKVALIEKHKMGGDCLNTGCVPSKALLRSAKMLSYIRRHKEFGIKRAEAEFDFADIMDRVQRVIGKVEPHDSVERYTGLGVDCHIGEARVLSPNEVRVNGRTLTTRNLIITTGARPFVPPIPGLDKVSFLTTDTLWNLRELPGRFVILGGGPIGSEIAQAFNRFGSRVTQVEMLPTLLNREDEEIGQAITDKFRAEGIDVRTGTRCKEVLVENGQACVLVEKDGESEKIPFDELLVAVGRAANARGLGLEELGVKLGECGTLDVDPYLQSTSHANIYAAGDVAGPYQFTHTAAHQAWYATVNALFGPFVKFRADYRVIPWCTFTDPEVARVGLNEREAKAAGIPYEVTRYGIDDLDRAIADSEDHGVVKVLTERGRDRILGVTLMGHHAGDLIAEYVLAMKHGLGLNKILGTIHIYPTLAEANKFAAGEWKRAHLPGALLKLAEKIHRFRR